MNISIAKIKEIVLKQLKNYWFEIDERALNLAMPDAVRAIEENYRGLPNKCYYDGCKAVLSPYMSVQWMNFLYRLSYILFKNGYENAAGQVYYLNKIMHSNDWFYKIELPTHFLCEHPIGSVLGRAVYGDYFFVYQGTTVGGNRKKGKLLYPKIGNNVILYADASVLGDAHIGNNVVVSAGSCIINEDVPDNCIVFGKSPNLEFKIKSESEIKQYTQHIWGWES